MVIRLKYKAICLVLGICFVLYSAAAAGKQLYGAVVKYTSPLTVLIIDPGHGGADGGAVGVDGILESEINLAIGLKLEAIAHLLGIPTVMTRKQADIMYPDDANSIGKMKIADQKARLGLIRDCSHGILYSIHQNYYPDHKPSGVQVLYGHTAKSRELGLLMQSNLEAAVCSAQKRSASEISYDIYLFRDLTQDAILIECGFLSNSSDVMNLKTDTYQRKLAVAMAATYLQYTAHHE